MNATKGYYCLVQYCPDFARQEAANVGVVLFCPELRFLKARMADSIQRIRRFFGQDSGGYHHLRAMQMALVQRLAVEHAEFQDLESLLQFVNTRANKVVLTQPKPVKVFDAEADLEALFIELVVEPTKPPTKRAALSLRKRLDTAMGQDNLKPYLHKDIEVEVPALRESITVPYAYQNNRFNLIRPVEFNHKHESSVKSAACKHGVEGLTLFNHRNAIYGETQLIVVGDFSLAPSGAEAMVKDIFAESRVRLFTAQNLAELETEILTHGHPVADS